MEWTVQFKGKTYKAYRDPGTILSRMEEDGVLEEYFQAVEEDAKTAWQQIQRPEASSIAWKALRWFMFHENLGIQPPKVLFERLQEMAHSEEAFGSMGAEEQRDFAIHALTGLSFTPPEALVSIAPIAERLWKKEITDHTTTRTKVEDIAKHPNAQVDLIRRLSSKVFSSDVRVFWAKREDVRRDEEILKELLRHGGDSALVHVARDKKLLERREVVQALVEKTLPNTWMELLEAEAVQKNLYWVRTILKKNKEEKIFNILAFYPHIRRDHECLDIFLDNLVGEVPKALASDAAITGEKKVWEKLIKFPDLGSSLARNPGLRQHPVVKWKLLEMYEPAQLTKRIFAVHKEAHADPEVLSYLLKNGNPKVIELLAGHPELRKKTKIAKILFERGGGTTFDIFIKDEKAMKKISIRRIIYEHYKASTTLDPITKLANFVRSDVGEFLIWATKISSGGKGVERAWNGLHPSAYRQLSSEDASKVFHTLLSKDASTLIDLLESTSESARPFPVRDEDRAGLLGTEEREHRAKAIEVLRKRKGKSKRKRRGR